MQNGDIQLSLIYMSVCEMKHVSIYLCKKSGNFIYSLRKIRNEILVHTLMLCIIQFCGRLRDVILTFFMVSEYMLGEDILVAPIVEQGAVSRDIYLPKGQWRDEAKADRPVHTGPVWLRNYPAPLDTLPYFTRVSSGAGQISVAILLLVGISSLLTIFR